jgi:hypothetical protein
VTSPRGWRRWRRPVTIGLAVIALAIAAALANVALLGSAGEDRLGHLRPVDSTLSTPRTSTAATPPPATTIDADGDHAESPGDGQARGRVGGGDGDDDD